MERVPECCDLCAEPGALAVLEERLLAEQTPTRPPLHPDRIRSVLLDASVRARGRPDHLALLDEAVLSEFATVVTCEAERQLFRAEDLRHALVELYDGYAAAVEAAQERWYARLRPRLLAVIEAGASELEADLTAVFARFAEEHAGLIRAEPAVRPDLT